MGKVYIEGPDRNRGTRTWLIDGRDNEIPEGSIYVIKFKYGKTRRQMKWEAASVEQSAEVMTKTQVYQHTYSVCGSWTSWVFQDLTRDPKTEGIWEGTFRIGGNGQEEFY